ncbi:hypothetical protein OG226_41510 [Streptomyces sp. NBC_01261]|uniref:hypothetical protein n=1 Tax=unclassified Streptomyces TaxID=2593676 RepID=UPI002E33B60F|nr:hypothetical protein [Streptomyces sp. NBC_01261]
MATQALGGCTNASNHLARRTRDGRRPRRVDVSLGTFGHSAQRLLGAGMTGTIARSVLGVVHVPPTKKVS